MENPLGLKGSLAASFAGLAVVLLWLNYSTASDIRRHVVQQREVEKARTVASIIEPMVRHESQWVQAVARLLQHDLEVVLQQAGGQQTDIVTELLDRTYRQADVDVLQITDDKGIIRYRAHDPARKGDPATFWGVEEALAGNPRLVSVTSDDGPLILYVAPIFNGDRIVATLCTGTRIDDEFIQVLSLEIGADLALVSHSGKIAASSAHWRVTPDTEAINEAFQRKDMAFRASDGSRVTQVYLPVLIIDDAWVMITEINSRTAFLAIDAGNRKAAIFMIGSIAGAILLILLLLRINLAPLHSLRLKAERLVAEETGEAVTNPPGDDLQSVVQSLNNLTDILVRRNRLLFRQKSALKVSAVAFESQQALAIINAELEVISVNKAFTASTGFAIDDLAGQSLAVLNPDVLARNAMPALLDMISRHGIWQGEIRIRRKNGTTYPVWLTISGVRDDDQRVTHCVVSQIDLTENKRAEQRIHELAFYDPTTCLPNRRLLMDRLKQAIATSVRSRRCGAILHIDIDDFKTLNNLLGHDSGDSLLHQIGQRLSGCIREAETVARLGGDEFVVLLGGLNANLRDAALQAKAAGSRILNALNVPYAVNGTTYHCSASIGVALFFGQEATVDNLLKQADLALGKAKDSGRNGLQFFDPEMQTSVMERAALENDLRQAIELSQFTLHYQPQVLADGRITGAEALIRWNHPERGMVAPAAFIPLAEKSGLIVPLGKWVLRTACTRLAAWSNRPEMSHLSIAVNVSARQFHLPDFVEHVFRILNETQADPGRLKLELTESLLVENVQEVIEKMQTLKARGVSFSLDDFGTGYSSLSYLKQLPLEQLKIDQSFVRDILVDPNDAAIATTIIALAENLGLQVLAEGVETAEQRDFLADSGCHAYQGYFFYKPLPVDEFESHVAASNEFSPEFRHRHHGGRGQPAS